MAALLGSRLGGDIGAIFEMASFFAVRTRFMGPILLTFSVLRLIAFGFVPRIFRADFTRGGALAGTIGSHRFSTL
jgi:hypothetical protein